VNAKCDTLSREVQWRVDTVAGIWLYLLMAGDDDDVYDKKPQRYAEDNRAAFIS